MGFELKNSDGSMNTPRPSQLLVDVKKACPDRPGTFSVAFVEVEE